VRGRTNAGADLPGPARSDKPQLQTSFQGRNADEGLGTAPDESIVDFILADGTTANLSPVGTRKSSTVLPALSNFPHPAPMLAATANDNIPN
jgi:hypothetical protein